MASRILKRLVMRFVVWMVIIALSALVLFGAMAAWSVFQKERIVKNELNRTAEYLADLDERESALQATLSALETERGIESEVRQRFPLAKSGEEVIVLLDAKDSAVDSDASLRKSIWQSFWGLFTR